MLTTLKGGNCSDVIICGDYDESKDDGSREVSYQDRVYPYQDLRGSKNILSTNTL